MPKYLMILLAGAMVTFFVHKTSKMYGYIAGAITAFLTYHFWGR